jgi:hypothetical protein
LRCGVPHSLTLTLLGLFASEVVLMEARFRGDDFLNMFSGSAAVLLR